MATGIKKECVNCHMQIPMEATVCPYCHEDPDSFVSNYEREQRNKPNYNNQPSYGSGGGVDWSELTWNKVLAVLLVFGGSGAWLWFMNLDAVSDWVSDLPDFFCYLIMLGPIALCIFFGFRIGLKD